MVSTPKTMMSCGADGLCETSRNLSPKFIWSDKLGAQDIRRSTFVKASSAWRCMEEDIDISPQERYFAVDTEYEVNDRGEIVEATARISLAKNIRFTLALNRKAHNVAEPFDPSVEWWSCMREAIKIRDRLTHPRWPRDLDVSGDEVVKVLKAKQGFEEELLRHDPNAANTAFERDVPKAARHSI